MISTDEFDTTEDAIHALNIERNWRKKAEDDLNKERKAHADSCVKYESQLAINKSELSSDHAIMDALMAPAAMYYNCALAAWQMLQRCRFTK
jgi:hypothetical protein